MSDPFVELKRIARKHKRENELNRRRNRRAECIIGGLSPGVNRLGSTDFCYLVEYLFFENNGTAHRALREGRFALGAMVVERIGDAR